MKKLSLICLSGTLALTAACAVIWAADWPTQSGNPQRDGWAKTEKAFTKANASKIEFLYKYKTDNQAHGLDSLTSPVILERIIGYLGFKELLVMGGSGDNVWSVDADLGRIMWKNHFEYKADKPQQTTSTVVCAGGLSAFVAMPGSSTAGGGRGPGPGRAGAAGRGPGGAGAGRGPGAPGAPGGGRAMAPAGPPMAPPAPPLFGAGNFGRGANFAAIASDGSLHALNSANGVDRVPGIKFLPPNAKVSAININEGVVYAATQDNCGGNPNGIYAIDLATVTGPATDTKVSTLELNGGGTAGNAGVSVGTDGTVYAQIPNGKGEVAGDYNDTVISLSKDLKVKDYFTPSSAPVPVTKGVPTPGVTPVVFSWKGSDVIVSAGRDGKVYLLDSKSLGGADHHTPLFATESVVAAESKFDGSGFQGAFASWEDADNGNTRWVYGSFWGPKGGVIAFKVEDRGGKPALVKAWSSRDLQSPAPVATANGLVFALSSGESSRYAKEDGKLLSVAEKEKAAGKAVLYVLDGETGKELYNSGTLATTFSHGSGVSVANRRIYFTTHDNTVYSLGFLAEQPQLTGK